MIALPVPVALVQRLADVSFHGDETVILTDALRKEYESRFASLIVRPPRVDEAQHIVNKIVASKSRYEAVAATSSVPWFVIGVIHQMECGGNFDCHLHNGDPLGARTVRAPAGRPPASVGNPPFTWEVSANDALAYERSEGSWRGITDETWKEWDVASTLFKIELYNGWGYRERDVTDPYIYAATQFYQSGKFIEKLIAGHYKVIYKPNLVSEQIGAAALLRLMSQQGVVAFPVDDVTPNCETP